MTLKDIQVCSPNCTGRHSGWASMDTRGSRTHGSICRHISLYLQLTENPGYLCKYVEARSLPHVPYSPRPHVKCSYEYLSEVEILFTAKLPFKINLILRDQTQKECSNLRKKSKQIIWQKVSVR